MLPPVTGGYTFWVSSDDSSHLYLSTDHDPANKRLIASVSGFTDRGQFDKQPSQKSEPIRLEAGGIYYLEVIHKEGAGDDHLTVAWEIPGQPRAVIGQEHLLSFFPSAADGDDDGIPDAIEAGFGLDPAAGDDAMSDADQDGLAASLEMRAGSDPNNPTSDSDAVFDGADWALGGSPLANDMVFLPPDPWAMHSLIDAPNEPAPRRPFAGLDTNGVLQTASQGLGWGVEEGQTDSLDLLAREISGGFELTAAVEFPGHVQPLPPVGPGHSTALSAAGLIARAGTAPEAPFFALMASPSGTCHVQMRTVAGRPSETGRADAPFLTMPKKWWLKLRRQGGRFTAYVSQDKISWDLFYSEELPLAEPYLVGLAHYAGLPHHIAGSRFSSVELLVDGDNDGLFDHVEHGLGTRPDLVDTDGDGFSDFDESQILFSNPLVADLGAQAEIARLAGTAFQATFGQWNPDARGLVSHTVRGSADGAFAAADAGVYLLEWTVSSAHNNTPDPTFRVEVSLDGQFLDRAVLVLPEDGSPVSLRVVTPWLAAGQHTARLFLDNTLSHRRIRIESLSVQRINGPDENGNGIQDWIDSRLDRLNGLEVAAPEGSDDGGRIESPVSPVCLEGTARYLEMLAVTAGGQALQPVAAPGDGWFANAGFPEGQTAMEIVARFENGGRTERAEAVWAETDALNLGLAKVRVGDRIRLVASGPNPVNLTIVSPSGQSAAFALVPCVAPVVHAFAEEGVYKFTTLVGATRKTVQVEAVDAAFNGIPAAGLGVNRGWDNPDLNWGLAHEAPEGVEFGGMNWFVTPSGKKGTRIQTLRTHNQGLSPVIARVAPNGPVAAQTFVQGIRVSSNAQTSIDVLERYADGSVLVGIPLILSDVPADIRVLVDLVVAGVVFEDGTITKTFTAADFDEFGRVQIRFISTADAMHSACHDIKVYQGDRLLGRY